ncbi:MAG: hypothetical protein PHR30_09245 [Gallionellaceae bacterium]|nr:hypothetical protein [Gallionellaceae bacterium]
MASQSYQEIAGVAAPAPRVSPGPVQADQGSGTSHPASAEQSARARSDTSYEPEVVFVFEQFRLIDAESYQRTYTRKNSSPLLRGYYVVTWPTGREGRKFGDEASFHGPYRSRKDAENSLAKPRLVQSPDIQHARIRAAIALLVKQGTGPARVVGQQRQA